MQESLYQLVYMSAAAPELTKDALIDILAAAQKNNAKRGITGLLLHSDGNVIQVIEGQKEDVEALYSKIENDSRHENPMVLYRKAITERDFPEFKMGFRTAKLSELEANFPAFTDLVQKRQLPKETMDKISKRAATFLRTFARTTRLEN